MAEVSVVRVRQGAGIDVDFDFRSDTPAGKDPDRWSPTLRGYHRWLWSKRLPGGAVLSLDDTTPFYLHHRSDLGEFFLSSDAVIPTYRAWLGPSELVRIVAQTDRESLDQFQHLAYTVGAMMVFPGNQVAGQWTINQARGMLARTIADRLDLTLECIRRHYLGQSSPLADTIGRYDDFFGLFGDFRGYVDFFLLGDLVADDYSRVDFFLPFEEFTDPALPQDSTGYETYRQRSLDFVRARNRRVDLYSRANVESSTTRPSRW